MLNLIVTFIADTLFPIYNICISSNIIHGYLILENTCIFICRGKPNGFQYYFVNIH